MFSFVFMHDFVLFSTEHVNGVTSSKSGHLTQKIFHFCYCWWDNGLDLEQDVHPTPTPQSLHLIYTYISLPRPVLLVKWSLMQHWN